jgi:AcrR family transcriptional regulator
MSGTRLAPEVRTAELMRAARGLLREVGYEKFVPAEVARRCGVSEALVYKYFPTKRELLIRVVDEWFAEVLGVEPELANVHGHRERLRYVITYSLQVIRQEPELTRFIFLELRTGTDYRTSSVYRLNKRFTGIVEGVLRDAVAAGDLREDVDVHLLRDLIFGTIEHRTWTYLRGEGDFPLQETADAIAAIVYRGLSTTSSPS